MAERYQYQFPHIEVDLENQRVKRGDIDVSFRDVYITNGFKGVALEVMLEEFPSELQTNNMKIEFLRAYGPLSEQEAEEATR